MVEVRCSTRDTGRLEIWLNAAGLRSGKSRIKFSDPFFVREEAVGASVDHATYFSGEMSREDDADHAVANTKKKVGPSDVSRAEVPLVLLAWRVRSYNSSTSVANGMANFCHVDYPFGVLNQFI